MKAILVIDMPKGCKDCQFNIGGSLCTARSIEDGENSCPLRPIPSEYCVSNKSDQFDNERWFYGYNKAIRDIVGDENIEY